MADKPSPGAIAAAQVAYDAGFRGRALVNMVALAGAESNYNPLAHNPPPGQTSATDDSYGYWQINYKGDLAQSRTSQFGPASGLVGSDPTGPEAHRNAQAAYALSGGGVTLSPWKADFNNGRYYQYLPEAESAVAQFLGGSTMVGAVGSPYQFATSTGTPPTSNPATGAGVDVPASTGITGDEGCFWWLPKIGPFGGGCMVQRATMRKAMGGAILVGGGIVGLFGIMLLAGKSADITGVLGKVTPSGWVTGIAARSRQQRTDEDAAYVERVQREQRNDPDRERRAREAFRGESFQA